MNREAFDTQDDTTVEVKENETVFITRKTKSFFTETNGVKFSNQSNNGVMTLALWLVITMATSENDIQQKLLHSCTAADSVKNIRILS